MYEELVGDLRYCYKGDCNGCRRYTKDTRFCYDLMREAADAIEELSKQNKKWEEVVKTALDFIPCWVSVEERLPEKEGMYLVCCQPYKAQWVTMQDYRHDAGFSGSCTHWMELPPFPDPIGEET